MEKKQTAVEWLEEELKLKLKKIILNGDSELIESLFEQAIEMERQQIIDAYNSGQQKEAKQEFWTKGIQYFEETYGKTETRP